MKKHTGWKPVPPLAVTIESLPNVTISPLSPFAALMFAALMFAALMFAALPVCFSAKCPVAPLYNLRRDPVPALFSQIGIRQPILSLLRRVTDTLRCCDG